MADTSAPEYPNLQGNSSANNMKNSVANCKVRASRKQARHGHCQPDTCMRGRKTLPGLRHTKHGQALAWASVTSQSSAGQLFSSSHSASAGRKPSANFSANSQADDRQTVPSLIPSLASVQHIHTTSFQIPNSHHSRRQHHELHPELPGCPVHCQRPRRRQGPR
jgi:hypothetical protein